MQLLWWQLHGKWQMANGNAASGVKCAEETPYYGGSFRLKLVLSEDFPASPPRGFFLTRIYHPNVASNGDICVNTLKRDWNADVTLSHVLQVGLVVTLYARVLFASHCSPVICVFSSRSFDACSSCPSQSRR